MKHSLTESVARLYRAGSEHSKQTEKLRQAVDNLLKKMMEILPPDFSLPFNCRIYPSGDFEYRVCGEGSVTEDFSLTMGKKHPLSDLHLFSKLINDGFLDRISEKLENEAATLSATTLKIDSSIK